MDLEASRSILVRHSRSKKNGILVASPTHAAQLLNAKCGDRVELTLRLDGEAIVEIGYRSTGCAICAASSSLLCESVRNQTTASALRTKDEFLRAIQLSDRPWPDELDHLRCFEHLRINPARRNCAYLAWQTLQQALLLKTASSSLTVDQNSG